MEIYQNKIQNIFNLGGDCSSSQDTLCNGYMMYVPCVKSILRGDDECLQFYIINQNGDVIDNNTVGDIYLMFSTEYGCQTSFTGQFLPSNFNDDSSDSDDIDVAYIKSLQENYNATTLNIDFDNDIEPQDYYVSFDEYSNPLIISSTNLKKASISKIPCASLLCNILDGGMTSAANFTIKSIKCSQKSNIHISLIVENEASSYTLNILINGKMYKYDFSVENDIDSSSDWITKEIDIPFCAYDEDTSISVMSMESNTQHDVFITYISIETEKVLKNKGLFGFCLTSEQTEQLVRGSLKMNGWIVLSDGSKFPLGCARIADVM